MSLLTQVPLADSFDHQASSGLHNLRQIRQYLATYRGVSA
jgi:hypothetical protein